MYAGQHVIYKDCDGAEQPGWLRGPFYEVSPGVIDETRADMWAIAYGSVQDMANVPRDDSGVSTNSWRFLPA